MLSPNHKIRSAANAALPLFETMEARQLMSVTFNVPLQQLQVVGTGNNDVINIYMSGGKIAVQENGATSFQSPVNVKSIKVEGREGNDAIYINTNIKLPTQLLGNGGNDTLRGGNGVDALFGGLGDDVLDGRGGGDAMFGGAGVDTADYSLRSERVSVFVGEGINDDGESGEGDTVDGDIENVWGGAGDDIILAVDKLGVATEIRGNGGNDILHGRDGDDVVKGGEGNDTITCGIGDDQAFGDAGDDDINGSTGDDSLHGGEGNDRIYGDYGNDFLFGDAGNDEIHGDIGNDFLSGGNDNDRLLGDAGTDSLYGDDGDDSLDGGANNDRMTGGNGTDKADYASRTTNLAITLDAVANDGASGEADNVLPDVENIYSGSGNDRIIGSDAANKILGGGGDDYINGAGGDDVIFGEAGNDRLISGVGTDSLFGGLGNDTLITIDSKSDGVFGGLGTDLFWVDSKDIIDADSWEKASANVQTVSAFADGVSIEPAGQDLKDPSLAGLSDRNAVYGPKFENNPLFNVTGPVIADVQQAELGTCYFLSTLAGVANGKPQLIRQSVTELGDGTFAVKFYLDGKAKFYRVDSQLPVVSGTTTPAFARIPTGALWVAIMEKAYAQFAGGGSYKEVEGGFPTDVMRHLGRSADYWLTSSHFESTLAAKIKDVLSKGGTVEADTAKYLSGLEAPHAYTVVAISGTTVTLRNPWGKDGKGGTGDKNDGLIEMSITRFDDDIWRMDFSYL